MAQRRYRVQRKNEGHHDMVVTVCDGEFNGAMLFRRMPVPVDYKFDIVTLHWLESKNAGHTAFGTVFIEKHEIILN